MTLLSSFTFGLIAGSFLNVVIYRLKNGGSTIYGRSFCPNCKKKLNWHDLVPLLSFLWLKGRCRHCDKKISWQYPIVEILSGLIWVSGFHAGEQSLNFIYYIFLFSVLLVVAIYDFKWQIILDKIIYPAIVVVLIFNLFNAFSAGNSAIFVWPFFTALAAFLFFFSIHFFSKGRAMGLGDAKLAFLMGLFLNPLSAVIAFALSFIIGAVFGILLIVFGKIFSHYKKWGMKSQIAFGPFLVIGTFIAFFFSDFIIKFFSP